MLPYFLKALLYGWHHSASADAALYGNEALAVFYRHSKKRGHKKPKKAALAPENYAEGDAIDIPYPKGTRKGEKKAAAQGAISEQWGDFLRKLPGMYYKEKAKAKEEKQPCRKG